MADRPRCASSSEISLRSHENHRSYGPILYVDWAYCLGQESCIVTFGVPKNQFVPKIGELLWYKLDLCGHDFGQSGPVAWLVAFVFSDKASFDQDAPNRFDRGLKLQGILDLGQ